jgi:hypothetical protein
MHGVGVHPTNAPFVGSGREAMQICRSVPMLVCMRTTLNISDALAEAVKARAQAEGRTFTSLVEEGLRAVLDREIPAQRASPLPAYGDPESDFLVDPADRDAVWSALDADGAR